MLSVAKHLAGGEQDALHSGNAWSDASLRSA